VASFPFRLSARLALRLAGLLVLPILAWIAGLVWYAATPPAPSALEASRPVDAIVVLTGGSERLRAGLDLLEIAPDTDLFITGVPTTVNVEDLWRALDRHPPPDLEAHVTLGHAAADTLGNAWETAAWARAHGYTSLRVVTAAYHMRRALLEFRHVMPDIRLLPHPVYPPHVKQKEWWRFPGTAALLAGEYTKYLVALARVSLGLPLRAPIDDPGRSPESGPPGSGSPAPLAAPPILSEHRDPT